jgi:hypothetical protein
MFWKKSKTNDKKKNGGESSSSAPPPPPRFPLPRGAMIDHSPTIVNETEYPIVVFLERGTLYNTQVLHPGEAVCMTRRQTGGVGLLPYRVHAMIGDEASLPKKSDSIKNLIKCSAIPAAFVAGCLATAMSAGTLAGPSAALAPMVSGMVVKGVVIDAAALAAGSVMASRAQIVTELLLRKQKDKFMAVSKKFMPGQRYLKVTGGISEGPLVIEEVDKRKARDMQVVAIKPPMAIRDDNKPVDSALLLEQEDSGNMTDQTESTVEASVALNIEEEKKDVSQSVVDAPLQKDIKKEGTGTKKNNNKEVKPSAPVDPRKVKPSAPTEDDLIPVTLL